MANEGAKIEKAGKKNFFYRVQSKAGRLFVPHGLNVVGGKVNLFIFAKKSKE